MGTYLSVLINFPRCLKPLVHFSNCQMFLVHLYVLY